MHVCKGIDLYEKCPSIKDLMDVWLKMNFSAIIISHMQISLLLKPLYSFGKQWK